MTQQTNGMPELKYSEETFRDMYEALKAVLPWAEQWIKYLRTTVGKGQGKDADEIFAKAKKALAEVE